MNRRSFLSSSGALLAPAGFAAAPDFQPTSCEGVYPLHLQGICTDGENAIYWSWTDKLVKTDRQGRILRQAAVANHHGDLCFHNGRVQVAVNLGKFNRPAGEADSWVNFYDAETLAEVARHPVPELVHGAGGMAFHDGKFIIVGGLPDDFRENYLYEYDDSFRFQKRHVLASGHTHLGIQTAAFVEGAWWFGCYGKPKMLLRADEQFQLTGKWEFDASLGIAPAGEGRFLIGQNTATRGVGHKGRVVLARPDQEKGLVME